MTTNRKNADGEHNQPHRHGTGHGHKHSHEGGGGHSHGRGEPLHGGRVVSIGHSHHANGATHYHAEVMPIGAGKITFHILVEAKERSQSFPVDATEIVAFIDRLDEERPRAREVVFIQEKSSRPGSFVADIPEGYRDCRHLSVVVPKIKLGGERLNFSFTATTGDEAGEIKPADEKPEEPAA